MTSKVLLDGKFVPDRNYDRGPMMVHPEEEWRRSVREHIIRPRVRAMWRLYLVLMLFPAGYYVLVLVNPGDLVTGYPAIVMAVAVTAAWVLMTVGFLWARSRAPLVGLYEQGFQVSHRVFLPYDEIGRVELDDPDALRIVLQRGKVIEWGPWRRVMVVLGEEGVKELTRRVHGPSWTA